MSLVLGIETSSARYGAALFTGPEVVVEITIQRDNSSFQGIGALVEATLDRVRASFDDIKYIAVDAGPGNLSAVRTGIAYANGLAFSLDRMIFCANSLELLAREVADQTDAAVVCLRNAGGGNVYAGLFEGDRTIGMRHGPARQVVPALVGDRDRVAAAGAFRSQVGALLPTAEVVDTGVEVPHVRALGRLLASRSGTPILVPAASPITESSEAFT